MSKLRQLIEAANRKCEMAWKVYSYNPEKDNELVDTSKAFDCIAAAQAHKREILEKNPNYTVEIIAESSQKNESKFSSQSTFNKAKDIAKDLQMTLIENSDGSLKRDKIHDYNYPMSIGEVAFYVDDWGYGTQEYNKYKNANIKTLSKGWKIELDNIVSNANKKYKDYNISYSMSSDGKRIYFKIVESKNESAQKNEDFYKYIDDVPTREIAKALKELGIKEPYATQKAKIADKLAKRFGLRSVPTPIEMTSVLDALPYFTEESAKKNEDDLRKKLTKWGLTYGNPDAPTEKIVDKLVKDFPELAKYKKEIIDKVNAHKKKHYADYDDVAFEILTRSESTQKNEAKTKSFFSVADAVEYLRNKYDKQYVGGIYVDDNRNPRYIYGNNDDGKGYIKIAEWHGFPSKTCTIFIESFQKNEDLSKHPKLQEVWHRWKFNTKYGLHYTSNAKDTQAYLAKITKPNTFWLEDEDTGKAIVQGTPKDLINFMLSHKNTIDESTQKSESKVNMPKLKNEIQAAVNKYFKDDKDLLEYVYIDTKKDKLGRDILEVRAELGYNDMVKLADHLDKIVTKYDRYAYFDQETSGIMTAVFESAQKNESLRDLNLELADDTNAIAASADKIRQRFEYRTLQNQSYDEKQAEKIYLEVRRELEKAKKMIDACYNKIG